MCENLSPKNWFVLQTQAGKEKKLKDSIDQAVEFSIPTYLPQKKMYYTRKGEFQIVKKVLFPGYVFIQQEIERLLSMGRDKLISERIQPVMFRNLPATVGVDEMVNIFMIAGSSGVIELSEVHWKEGENIVIKSGPLRNLDGKIVFIDRRKRKAKVMVRLLNKILPVTLGFQILEKEE